MLVWGWEGDTSIKKICPNLPFSGRQSPSLQKNLRDKEGRYFLCTCSKAACIKTGLADLAEKLNTLSRFRQFITKKSKVSMTCVPWDDTQVKGVRGLKHRQGTPTVEVCKTCCRQAVIPGTTRNTASCVHALPQLASDKLGQ